MLRKPCRGVCFPISQPWWLTRALVHHHVPSLEHPVHLSKTFKADFAKPSLRNCHTLLLSSAIEEIQERKGLSSNATDERDSCRSRVSIASALGPARAAVWRPLPRLTSQGGQSRGFFASVPGHGGALPGIERKDRGADLIRHKNLAIRCCLPLRYRPFESRCRHGCKTLACVLGLRPGQGVGRRPGPARGYLVDISQLSGRRNVSPAQLELQRRCPKNLAVSFDNCASKSSMCQNCLYLPMS